ncbi:hypothetical protein DJ628_06960 [Salmonella enterica]|nr:hypothetical protein [Salmonella enterica]EBF9365443.1 hypothetical protein [Salmonella enterica subsp. enterica serovar Thompson]EAB1493631.1 hypothetical protein [Salmonella enterica]EAB4405399.1 hypothetical protein [Salmonella enterica]EAM3273671.1 hypothetical protein [Salmonella enterica]
MNYRLQPAGNQYISLPIKNEYVSVLGNYKVSPFKETHSDTACIVRIIEIFSLNKLRTKGEKLYSLTGLTVPDTEAVANEINLLLTRYAQLCRQEEEKLSFRQREVTNAEVAWKSTFSKNGVSSIAEAKTNKTGHAERCYHLAVSRLNEQHSRLSTIKLLPGVLADEVNYIGKGVEKRLLSIFPQSGQIPADFISVFNDGDVVRDIKFITDALKSLSDSVNEIISRCSVPTDRYVLNNGGMARTMAYREYYRADNYVLRSVVSDRDYVEHVMKYNRVTEYKNKIFS